MYIVVHVVAHSFTPLLYTGGVPVSIIVTGVMTAAEERYFLVRSFGAKNTQIDSNTTTTKSVKSLFRIVI